MSELSINPPFNSNLSPDEIRRCDPTQLGIGFFCFLAAELLKANYPQAELWRLTDRERARYQHVFVRIDGKPCDTGGFRSVDDMRFDLNDYSLIEKLPIPKGSRIIFIAGTPQNNWPLRGRCSPRPLIAWVFDCLSWRYNSNEYRAMHDEHDKFIPTSFDTQ